jgi:uncharacterized tellurite resistance protein B-like protein
MAEGILGRIVAIFEGDQAVRRVANDPALSAELLLLFRMILADGTIEQEELETFRRICREAFGIADESFDEVMEYLHDFGYETSAMQAASVFRMLKPERKQALVRHLAAIAKADHALDKEEVKLLKRTVEILGLDPREATAAGL